MDELRARFIARRQQLITDLMADASAKAVERADRYLQAQHHGIVPHTVFAPASAECIDLFRDGHYYGAISLSQAVAEALARHMCTANKFTPSSNFEKNVRTLHRGGFIDAATNQQFLSLWDRRDDYHHLNAGIETDRSALETLALTKLRALSGVEGWVFAWSPGETPGTLAVKFPQYWPGHGDGSGRIPVFLRNPEI